jgi:hypothetical protein
MKKSSSLPGSPDMIKEFNRPGGRYIPAWIKGNKPNDKTEVKTKVKQRRKSKKGA